MRDGWSFVIITDGKEPAKTYRLIESIKAQGIPDYEIILSGNVSPFICIEGLHFVWAASMAEAGLLSTLRNLGCDVADYDKLCVLDDDYLLRPGWYDAMVKFGDNWQVLSCRIECPDGSRYWDWKTHRSSDGNHLIPYSDVDNPDVSISGGLICLKADVYANVQWDPERGFYQFEDVDYSNRLREAGYKFSINPQAVTLHDDSRYSSKNSSSVWRTE